MSVKHTSIKLPSPCEFINITPINPLISNCEIKVCYVQDSPNRNKSDITKDVAKKIANSLPGSPIVGYFSDSKQDFPQHSKELVIRDQEFSLKDLTRPYGFVDLGAKVWFQKFLDDGVNEREYLMTEGYIWTGQYPEAKSVLEEEKGQSMEFDKKIIDAYWTKDENGKKKFFIINDAIISKLCIMGEEFEPCFEGAGFHQVEFSLSDEFKEASQNLISQMKEFIEKGGNTVDNEKKSVVEEVKINNEDLEYKKKDDEEENKKIEENSEKNEGKNNEESTSKNDNKVEDKEKKNNEENEEEDKKKKVKYSLDEIPEYTSLKADYEKMVKDYAALTEQQNTLQSQIDELLSFKKSAERAAKEEMIKSFYVLSDADKKDVVDNIDQYSLDEIESKLSVICVRNKVNFALDDSEEQKKDITSFSLDSSTEDELTPAWVKAVEARQRNI